MWSTTTFTARLGVSLPIVCAPMAGGPTTVALVAAVGQAGGLGVLAGGYRTAEQLDADIVALRAASSAPFGVNLLVPPAWGSPPSAREHERAVGLLAPYAAELGVAWPPEGPVGNRNSDAEAFTEQVDVVLGHRVPLFSFTFGIPDGVVLRALRQAGTALAGTATTVAEAQALADAGVDFVCAQGSEAGGHRGGFLGDPRAGLVGLAALVPGIAARTGVPVVAAGGLMHGAAVGASLVAGASAAQLGTAFLLCPEAGTSEAYRRALADGHGSDTVITSALSGRPARGLANRLVRDLADVAMPAYPVTNELTRSIRRAASEQGRPEFLSLWAGQGVAQARPLPAGDLVRALEVETAQALDRVCGAREPGRSPG